MEERLTALRETCLAKCRKCEEVEKEVEKEQQTNIEIRNAIPLASKASALRLQLATRQHQKNCMQDSIENERNKAISLEGQIENLEHDLSEYQKSYYELASTIAEETVFMQSHLQLSRDVLTMPKEQYQMCKEEFRTILVEVATSTAANDKPTEESQWLRKVIKTTKIQRKEKENELVAAEKSFAAQKARQAIPYRS